MALGSKNGRIALVAFLSIFVLCSLALAQDVAVGGDAGIGAAGYAHQATQAQQYHLPSSQVVSGYNHAIGPMPGFAKSVLGNEKMIVHTTYSDGSDSDFGAISENGEITHFQETPYDGSTVRVYVSQATIARIANSTNPVAELKRAWGSDIRFEGLNPFSQIKFFFTDVLVRISFFFVPSEEKEMVEASPSPEATIEPSETPTGTQEEEPFPWIDCSGGANLTNGGQSLTGEDRDRFTNITDNITFLPQPNGYTCEPTSGAIDLLHWNDTIAPGIVNMSATDLINDLAKRMNTTTNGTKGDAAARAIAQYISDHGFGANFTVEIIYKGFDPHRSENAGNTTLNFTTNPNGVSYYDVKAQVLAGQNVIVNVKIDKTGGHAMKLIAFNTKRSEDGTHLVAFADPESGRVAYGSLSDDGTIDIYGRKLMKITSIIAVSPKNSAVAR